MNWKVIIKLKFCFKKIFFVKVWVFICFESILLKFWKENFILVLFFKLLCFMKKIRIGGKNLL